MAVRDYGVTKRQSSTISRIEFFHDFCHKGGRESSVTTRKPIDLSQQNRIWGCHYMTGSNSKPLMHLEDGMTILTILHQARTANC